MSCRSCLTKPDRNRYLYNTIHTEFVTSWTTCTRCNPRNLLPELFETDEQRSGILELALSVGLGDEQFELRLLFEQRLKEHGCIVHNGWSGSDGRFDRDGRRRGGSFVSLRLKLGQEL
jgi:hypothetical protein